MLKIYIFFIVNNKQNVRVDQLVDTHALCPFLNFRSQVQVAAATKLKFIFCKKIIHISVVARSRTRGGAKEELEVATNTTELTIAFVYYSVSVNRNT